ncbi:Hypothetical protein ABZS17G119_02013 [Kosakonia cowanii]
MQLLFTFFPQAAYSGRLRQIFPALVKKQAANCAIVLMF